MSLNFIKRIGKPVLVLCKANFVGGPLTVLDIISFDSIKYALQRKRNINADYVLLGFRIKPELMKEDDEREGRDNEPS